jgi:G3E family GTPase
VPTACLAAPQLDTSKFQPSDYDDNQIISNQVDICDVLIANKCDVVSPAKAQVLVDWAQGLFPPKHQVSKQEHQLMSGTHGPAAASHESG